MTTDRRHPRNNRRHSRTDLRHPRTDGRHSRADRRHPRADLRHPRESGDPSVVQQVRLAALPERRSLALPLHQ